MIWTTTPWTIPANQALNVHPEFNYALVDVGDKPAGAGRRAGRILPGSLRTSKVRCIATTTGTALELINFRHPFYDRLSPVYLADYVELGAGTGVVHCSPGLRRGRLRDLQAVRHESTTTSSTRCRATACTCPSLEFFGGQFIWKANPPIVDKLTEVGALLHTETHQPQLHALLAPQDSADLPRHRAVVRRHGQAAESGRHPARRARSKPSKTPSSSRPGARRACTR